MEVELLYFGMIAEATGTNSEVIVLDEAQNVDQLRSALQARHPKLDEMRFQIAINEEIVDAGSEIPAKAKVALLPPFAGG